MKVANVSNRETLGNSCPLEKFYIIPNRPGTTFLCNGRMTSSFSKFYVGRESSVNASKKFRKLLEMWNANRYKLVVRINGIGVGNVNAILTLSIISYVKVVTLLFNA